MKKISLVLALFLSLGLLALSCKKSGEDCANNSNHPTTNPVIKKNQTFQYNFGTTGIEDGFSISQQARNFEISSLSRDNSGKMIYTYKPVFNYTGTEEVVINQDVSNGASVVKTVKTTIRITITD